MQSGLGAIAECRLCGVLFGCFQLIFGGRNWRRTILPLFLSPRLSLLTALTAFARRMQGYQSHLLVPSRYTEIRAIRGVLLLHLLNIVFFPFPFFWAYFLHFPCPFRFVSHYACSMFIAANQRETIEGNGLLHFTATMLYCSATLITWGMVSG